MHLYGHCYCCGQGLAVDVATAVAMPGNGCGLVDTLPVGVGGTRARWTVEVG